jgi:hypothetical protein
MIRVIEVGSEKSEGWIHRSNQGAGTGQIRVSNCRCLPPEHVSGVVTGSLPNLVNPHERNQSAKQSTSMLGFRIVWKLPQPPLPWLCGTGHDCWRTRKSYVTVHEVNYPELLKQKAAIYTSGWD